MDIVCRLGHIRSDAVVLVATVKALKHHAGDPDGGLDAMLIDLVPRPGYEAGADAR